MSKKAECKIIILKEYILHLSFIILGLVAWENWPKNLLILTFNLQVVCIIDLVLLFLVWGAEDIRSGDLKRRFFGLGVALILIKHAADT